MLILYSMVKGVSFLFNKVKVALKALFLWTQDFETGKRVVWPPSNQREARAWTGTRSFVTKPRPAFSSESRCVADFIDRMDVFYTLRKCRYR